MKRRIVFAAWVLAVLLNGCFCRSWPNGEDGKLEFDVPAYVVQHAEHRVILPAEYHSGGRKLDPAPVDIVYDFDGTTLDTTGTTGLTLLDVHQREDKSWFIHFRCDSSPARLRVKVMADGKARYEDAYSIGCPEPSVVDVSRSGRATWVTGAWRSFDLAPYWNKDAGASLDTPVAVAYVQVASGSPFELDGGTNEEGASTSAPIEVHALGPASSLALRSGDWTFEVPITVAADSEWALALRSRVLPGVTNVAAFAQLPDGGTAEGLYDCIFQVDGGTMTGNPDDACSVDVASAGVAHVCATARGKSACTDVAP